MPKGWYVLTRRFSSKEEKRRIVAAICDPATLPAGKIGFENHVNVFHDQKNGLDPLVAKGLAVYLNSTLVDLFFRQFSGHTQVNAADLRTLQYPSLEVLSRLGAYVNGSFPEQGEIDALLEEEIERHGFSRSVHNGQVPWRHQLGDRGLGGYVTHASDPL